MSALTDADLDAVALIAARAVHDAVMEERRWIPELDAYPAALREPAAVFVTLRRRGQLRGCIGTLEPMGPLVVTAADRARAAAFDDPRFDPVQPHEIGELRLSVSVLSPLEPMVVDSYDELLRALRPGVDGIVIEAGRHRATFLPAVWDDLPTATQFLEALWRKASLPGRAWPPSMRVSRYTARHSAEVPLRR